MNGKEIVKDILKKQDKKNAEFADMLNISPNALWDRLNNTRKTKDLSVSTLNDMLRVLGYKILIVPRDTKVEDSYKVD